MKLNFEDKSFWYGMILGVIVTGLVVCLILIAIATL